MSFLGIITNDDQFEEAVPFANIESFIDWAYDNVEDYSEVFDEAGIKHSKSPTISEKAKVVETALYEFDFTGYDFKIHCARLSSGKYERVGAAGFEKEITSLSTTTKSLFASSKPAASAPVAVSSVPNKGLWIEKFECWEDELEEKQKELMTEGDSAGAVEIEGLITARDLRKKAIIARASSSTPSSSPSTKGNWLEDLELWEDELDEEFKRLEELIDNGDATDKDEERADSISGAIAVRDGAKNMAYYDTSSPDDEFVKEEAENSPEHKALERMIVRENSQKKSRNFKQNGSVFYPKDGKYEEGIIASLGKHQLTIKTKNGKFVTKDKMDCYVLE